MLQVSLNQTVWPRTRSDKTERLISEIFDKSIEDIEKLFNFKIDAKSHDSYVDTSYPSTRSEQTCKRRKISWPIHPSTQPPASTNRFYLEDLREVNELTVDLNLEVDTLHHGRPIGQAIKEIFI